MSSQAPYCVPSKSEVLSGPPAARTWRSLRIAVSGALGCVLGLAALAVTVGLGGSSSLSIVLAFLVAVGTALLLTKKVVIPLDASAASPALARASALGALVALVLLARLTVFMIDAAQAGMSSIPGSAWEVRHSCLTAYYLAGEVARGERSVFDESLYTEARDAENAGSELHTFGPFRIDVYEYPPPFLLLPRALLLVAPNFSRLRALWFGLNVGVSLLAMVVVARALGPTTGTRALLLSPLVWGALPTLSVMQKGNVQALIVALAMLAMVMFERRRFASGGALLGFAIVSKLFPALLLVYLLARREWRALAWTTGASVLLMLAALIDVGWFQYLAFARHLPELVGGEAFGALRTPLGAAINYSVPGLVFKLGLFGAPGMDFGAAQIVGWIWTVLVLGVTLVVSRRMPRDAEKPLVWLAILILATLRSPFLPQAYAAFPPLWLLALLAATQRPGVGMLGLTLLAWATFNLFWPLDWPIDPRLLALLSGLPQTLTVALVLLALLRAGTPSRTEPMRDLGASSFSNGGMRPATTR